MKILSIASEITPYAKTGGLADVAASLPAALAKEGTEVFSMMPYYRDSVESSLKKDSIDLPLERTALYEFHWDERSYRFNLLQYKAGNINMLFVENDELFNRDELYITINRENGKNVVEGYSDNFKRFALFSRVASSYILENDFDAVHTHDWQTALIPVYLHCEKQKGKRIPRSVHTIHNLAFQGNFPKDEFEYTALNNCDLKVGSIEAWGRLNLLKGAVSYADAVTTVSPTYAREIQTREYGCGLEEFLRDNNLKIKGILNGIDTSKWSPSTDPYLGDFKFGIGDIKGKRKFKEHLCSELGFKPEYPLFVMVSRLTHQKGLDILLEIMEDSLKLNCNMIVLGSGDPKYENAIRALEAKYHFKLRFSSEFNEPFAHRLYAAGDYFLMPSVFEPCGLGQLIAMRYGTLPIVRSTGGLRDTVIDINEHKSKGNGFVFTSLSSRALFDRIKKAVDFHDTDEFNTSVLNAFASDFSWKRSANEYFEIYKRGIEQ